MRTTIIDLNRQKNLRLPDTWVGGRALVLSSDSTIIVTRSKPKTFSEIRAQLERSGIKISPSAIEREIQAERRRRV